MFKKICILLLMFVLVSCKTSRIERKEIFFKPASPFDESELVTKESFRVGMLLPLSGEASAIGNGLKNAAMLALEDMNNPHLILQFYDTKSTPDGAREAAETAISQDVKMIIGPLMASEVEAVSQVTKSSRVPVVAFSTNENVLQNQVYTLGLLVGEQVDRIVEYAYSQGREKFALLVPDNSTGIVVARETLKAVRKYGGNVVKIAFYPPNTNDFSEIVKELTNYGNRASYANAEKERLERLARTGDEDAIEELRKFETKGASRGIDFDAIIIPESGSRLKSATAMFGYYDVFAPDVLFMGTSVWENTNLTKETALNKAVYPVLSRNYSAYFNRKYHSLFGVYPNALLTFGYDAVALASSLAKKNSSDLNAAITSPDGFSGISGAFRILPNGKNQHSLDIMQITSRGDVVVDAAEHNFADSMSIGNERVILFGSGTPTILGKDPEQFRNEVSGN